MLKIAFVIKKFEKAVNGSLEVTHLCLSNDKYQNQIILYFW